VDLHARRGAERLPRPGRDINDKHIEVILSQMLRKVRVENPGDTDLLPNEVVDKFHFRRRNNEVTNMARHPRRATPSCPSAPWSAATSQARPTPGRGRRQGARQGQAPRPATARTLLLGITKAALRASRSSPAPRSRRRPRCSPRPPSAAPRTPGRPQGERLLGHLIPAGTGFYGRIIVTGERSSCIQFRMWGALSVFRVRTKDRFGH
jgi:DNA-directed RNA polymerase subunit beta'